MSVESINEVIQKIATLTPAERQAIKDYLLEQEKKDAEAVQADRSDAGLAEEEPDPMRRREYEWIRQHRDQYAGQYVVVEGSKLIAHGTDGRKVLAGARQSGIRIPFIVRIESPDELPFGGW